MVNKLITMSLENMVQAKVGDISTSEKRIARKMLSMASLFSRADAVLDAYATAYEGDINNTKNPKAEEARAKLRTWFASVEKGYSQMHENRKFRIHFHLPPARSLLRLWKTKQSKSDDLRSFRNTILTISKGDHAPIKGIEIGRGGFAIRGLAPVLATDGRYLGSVEVLSTYDPLVKYSVSNENEFIAVYMNKEFLPIATRLKDAAKNPIVGDKFVFVSSTNKKVTDSLLTPKLLASGMTDMQKIRSGNHLVAVFPIKDFGGKQIGVMAYVYNAADLYGTLSSIRWGIAVFCVAFLLVMVGPLVMIVRKVTKPLNRSIQVLDSGAGQVASASNHIASSSQSLAEGASEQAASIEETSASLEEMSSMTKQNAENATQANSLMKEANAVVTDANQAMGELITSMNVISKASEETSKIIKTIDEIAFQTNLLALNAAVEAARAGDAGAGFAVVADEVRNLAMRAADAAKSTATLIEETVNKIETGTSIVKRTDEAFSQVDQKTSKVGELVEEIAAASSEQAQGIDQVNTAVVEMDKVTQQNAANAEESASSAEEMRAQAVKMMEVVKALTELASGSKEFAEDDKVSVKTPQRKPIAGVTVDRIGENGKSRETSILLEDRQFEDF